MGELRLIVDRLKAWPDLRACGESYPLRTLLAIQFPGPEQKTTRDFQSWFSEDHCRRGIRLLLAKRPHLNSFS